EALIARDGGSESTFQIDVPESLSLHTLRDALERALGNVIRNAVRYAGQAGPVEIRAAQDKADVRIVISDHGPGVPREALPRLFEPFFRPEAARARHSGGSGLGLAIVKRCIEACGGEATASLPETGGLMIQLTVPVHWHGPSSKA
ncbi:MAG: sensor histidine kinase, partial [Caldilineaceae bacterium]|nr:sensor histidine kinase [Caldilineaceae bacterium]